MPVLEGHSDIIKESIASTRDGLQWPPDDTNIVEEEERIILARVTSSL